MRKFLLVVLLLVTGCALGAQSVLKFNQFVTTLPSATTPLAGNEPTVVVQGGVSKQVPVNKLPGSSSSVSTNTVNSISNSDGSLTIGPTTGTVVASINPAHSNTWSPVQNFNAGFKLSGSTVASSLAGTASVLATVNGTLTNGHCITADSNGNLLDGGGSCVSSGSGVNAGNNGQAAYYATTGSIVSGISVGSLAYIANNTTASRAINVRANDPGVNILDFGADPTGGADSAPAIQAAIDSLAGSNAPINTIFCPAGVYKTTLPIFLDHPGDLRGSDGVNGNAFDNGAIYQLNDTANSGGIPYISLTPGGQVGHPPPNATFWRPFNWSSATTYALGDIVRSSGIPWISLQGSNTNNTPAANSAFWRPYYLTQSGFGGNPGGGSNFSFAFTGPEGLGWAGGYGCKITPTFNNGIWIIVGIGQRMSVRNMGLTGAVFCYHAQCDPNGIGIGIAGDSGGAQNVLLENLDVSGDIYTLFETSFNADGLGAETTWRKIYSSNCYNGIIINGSQNFINHVIDSNLGCIHDIIATAGPGVMVEGGGIGTEGSQAPKNNSFTLSGTTGALIPSHASGKWIYDFTATLATPDANITGCNPQGGCVYNRWVFPTAHFGPIPAIPQSYVTSTQVMTFQILQNWADWNFAAGNTALPNSADTYTDINNELKAVTTVYASEGVTMFEGNAITARHIHIENAPTCLELFNNHGVSGDNGSIFEGLFFNYDMTNAQSGVPNAAWYCQQEFPFIDALSGAPFRLDQNRFDGALGGVASPLAIDMAPLEPSCVFGHQGVQISNLTMRLHLSGGPNPTAGTQCEFDDPVFVATGNGAPSQQNNQQLLVQQKLPQIGWFQGPGNAYLTPAAFTILSNTSGHTLDQYPPINGGQVYTVLQNSDYYNSQGGTAGVAQLVQSKHLYYSWGQDITTATISNLSWQYKGGTNVVAADTGTLGLMFPGLGITLDNGSGPQHYLVSATYPTTSVDTGTHPGYFTVLQVPSNGASLLVGTTTTIYSCPGSCPTVKIGQDAFNWKTLTLN